MATAATQLQITIITPQWLDHPDINEKENKSLQQQQHEQNDTIEETTNLIATTTEDKTIKSQKIEPIHEWQKQKFDEWLTKNSFNMYPSRDEKEKLAEMLAASYLQITRLFANQRRRIHKKGKATTIKENDNLSIPSPTTTIPENEESPKINDITSEEINESSIEQMNIEISNVTTSSSERSISPPASSTSFSTFEDNNIAAICSAVADQIHVEQENKKCFEKSIPKKKSRKRKSKKISCDEKLLETTVDEILQKIARQDSEGKERKNEKELPPKQNTETEIETEKSSKDEQKQVKEDVEMPPVEVTSSSPNSSSEAALNSSLLSMVNEVVTQPPNALQLSAMGDVNPRLVEAMHLLNNGVSWTHPTILSVVIQIHQYQQQQREIQLAQQRAYLSARAFGSPMETSPPPGSESSYSHSSSKSTEELMSSLSPDECLAVNVLTDLANGW